jgi:nitroreductase
VPAETFAYRPGPVSDHEADGARHRARDDDEIPVLSIGIVVSWRNCRPWRGARHIASAPAAIALVVPAPPDERTKLIDQYDLGQATLAMTIAATDLGIGTGHSSIGDQDRTRAILGVPDDHLVSFLLGIGYPADRPLQPTVTPDRRPFDEVVHRGRWQVVEENNLDDANAGGIRGRRDHRDHDHH